MMFSRRSPFLSLAVVIALLAVAVSAQDKSTESSIEDATVSSVAKAESTASEDTQSTAQTSEAPATTSSAEAEKTASSTKDSSTSQDDQTKTSNADPTTTGSTSASKSDSSSVATTTGAIITGTTATGTAIDTDLPTLAGAYVSPTVPPTTNAPFMKQSNLPEGTVFIIVGAILGFLAMCVILWRGLVVWSLHRSIERAAVQQHISTAKSTFQTPPAPFYASKDRDSALSVGYKSGRKSTQPSTGAPVSNQSLFFSPTAGVNGPGNPGNRGSSYLPAGYYAAGASQLGNGQGMSHVGSTNPGISLSNLGPAGEGYAKARSVGTSEPGSPYITAMPSSSTLNLSQAPGDQRAPSAYLDDLFDSEGSPPVPSHRRNPSGAARRSARF